MPEEETIQKLNKKINALTDDLEELKYVVSKKLGSGSKDIHGVITGSIIIGGTIQTAISGQRIVMSSDTKAITFYDSDGKKRGDIYGSYIRMYDSTETLMGTFSAGTTGLNISAGSGDIIAVLATSKSFKPLTTGDINLGTSALKWNSVFYTNLTACPLPTVDNALQLLKTISEPKEKAILNNPEKAIYEYKGETKKRKYFDDFNMPEELTIINDVGEKDIELTRVVGFLLKVAKELNQKVEQLELKIT